MVSLWLARRGSWRMTLLWAMCLMGNLVRADGPSSSVGPSTTTSPSSTAFSSSSSSPASTDCFDASVTTTISTAAEASAFAEIPCIYWYGTILIGADYPNYTLELDHIESVGNIIVANNSFIDSFTAVEISSMGNMSFANLSALREVNLAKLGDAESYSLIDLPSISSEDSALFSPTGFYASSFQMINTSLTSLPMTQIAMGDLLIANNSLLTSISLDFETNYQASNNFEITNNGGGLVNIALTGLESAGAIQISSAIGIDLSGLWETHNLNISHNNVTNLTIPDLFRVYDTLTIEHNPDLQELSLPQLGVVDNLYLSTNANVYIPDLSPVNGSISVNISDCYAVLHNYTQCPGSHPGSDLSGGDIAGIVIGVVAAAAIIIAAIVWFVLRRRRRSSSKDLSDAPSVPPAQPAVELSQRESVPDGTADPVPPVYAEHRTDQPVSLRAYDEGMAAER